MRLWSLHPRYLDSKGLVALWREGLLARAVLLGQTRGYQNHPQVLRFRAHPEPEAAIDYYLEQVLIESKDRGYHFDPSKITSGTNPPKIQVTSGQVEYELAHLKKKLALRSPACLPRLISDTLARLNPLFVIVPGSVEPWEKILTEN